MSTAGPGTASDLSGAPSNLSRFVWTGEPGGGGNVTIYSPPDARVPAVQITGLCALDLTMPLPNTTFFGPLADAFFTFVQTARSGTTNGNTSQYVSNLLTYRGSATLAGLRSAASPSGQVGSLLTGLIPVGFKIADGAMGLATSPY